MHETSFTEGTSVEVANPGGGLCRSCVDAPTPGPTEGPSVKAANPGPGADFTEGPSVDSLNLLRFTEGPSVNTAPGPGFASFTEGPK